MISSKWIGLTALLAASHFALVAAKPITSRETLKPKVEVSYANVTGRVNGNIQEFLGTLS